MTYSSKEMPCVMKKGKGNHVTPWKNKKCKNTCELKIVTWHGHGLQIKINNRNI